VKRKMPLKGIPDTITAELLYVLAKMGHGDSLVIADANFPSDRVASNCIVKEPIRIHGVTSDILKDILELFPLDEYIPFPVQVMDRVISDKDKGLEVPAYKLIAEASGRYPHQIEYVERFKFYDLAKSAFAVVQTNDFSLYANCIITKGVIPK
jgi:L-fucose mutarotase